MNRRKELQQQYEEIKIQAGIFQIKNKHNGKIFIDSARNLKSINGTLFTLNMGNHMNKALQSEWNEYGEEAFEVSVLDILKKKEDEYGNPKEDLKKLEQVWLDRLQPYGERGYHRES